MVFPVGGSLETGEKCRCEWRHGCDAMRQQTRFWSGSRWLAASFQEDGSWSKDWTATVVRSPRGGNLKNGCCLMGPSEFLIESL